MLSQLSFKWVRLSSFLVNTVSTFGFILIVIFGVLVHLLGLVGLPWSLWGLGEIVLTGTLGTGFGWLLAATAFCSSAFAAIWLLAIISGVSSGGFHAEDVTLLFKVAISIAVTAASAVVVLGGSAEIPGTFLLIPWVNLGLWAWALMSYQ